MRKTTRRKIQVLAGITILSLVGTTIGTNVKLSDKLVNDYEQAVLIKRCKLNQVERYQEGKKIDLKYCDNKENLEKFRLPKGLLLDKLYLSECRITQGEENHIMKGRGSVYATDIACVKGQGFNARAINWGVISKIGQDERLGDYVILKQGEYEWVYGHTQTSLKEGVEINKGDVIGQINTSGMSQNYHLHFETWINGNNVKTSDNKVINNNTYKLKLQRSWLVKADTDKQETPGNKALDLNQLAYAVAMAETGNCKVGNSAERNNCFGIMQWKNGKRSFKSYATINDSYEDFKRIWKKYYKVFPTHKEAKKWTGKDREVTWLKNVTYYYES